MTKTTEAPENVDQTKLRNCYSREPEDKYIKVIHVNLVFVLIYFLIAHIAEATLILWQIARQYDSFSNVQWLNLLEENISIWMSGIVSSLTTAGIAHLLLLCG